MYTVQHSLSFLPLQTMSGFSQCPSRYPHLSYGYRTSTISFKTPPLITTVTAKQMDLPLLSPVSPLLKPTPTYHRLPSVPRPALFPLIQQTMTNPPKPLIYSALSPPVLPYSQVYN